MAPLNVSERLENPPVNTINVPGVCSASTVSAEVRVLQDEMRAVAARNPQAHQHLSCKYGDVLSPFDAGESDDGMASLLHVCPSKY
eukprot:3652575-Pleurochrysis_carterae.AAC.1